MPTLLALSALAFSTAILTTALPATKPTIKFQPCPKVNAEIRAVVGIDGSPFDCAQLEVPLDYTDANSPGLNLSLFRVNATKEPVLGSVLINFGGPGGTGAENLPTTAEVARKYIGPQWDLLTWDPRGTGYTIPFNCSVTVGGNQAVQKRKRDLDRTTFSANLTEIFLTTGWDDAGTVADFCYNEVDRDTATMIGTAFGARDMMSIVDALGEDGLLRFYGWSYGSALGSYAAAMFPDRIGAMVLDGNLNPRDYASGTYQDLNTDIDEAFTGFLETCFNVTDECALYTVVQPETPQDLLDAINAVLTPLVENATSSAEAYELYFTVKASFIEPLYYPTTWPEFGQNLAYLVNGTAPPTAASNTTRPIYGKAANAVIGIRASDATFHANTSDQYLPTVKHQANVSASFGDSFATIWPSTRWRLPAKERYWGDFHATTKTPILYVNGLYDPATPIIGAYKGSAGFEGSVVLAHEGYGHGVFVSPSECVARYTRDYFKNGILPKANITCPSDQTPSEIWRNSVAEAANETSAMV